MHHCIISESRFKVSQEKDVTVNVPPSEPLPKRNPKAIYPSYLIRAKKMSLDKVPNHEFSADIIMNKMTGGLGRRPGKRKSFQHKKVSTTSSRADRF